MALKQIHLSKLTRSLKDCLECERNFLSSVKHPNIIRLLDVFENILLSSFESDPVLKIADFGLSSTISRIWVFQGSQLLKVPREWDLKFSHIYIISWISSGSRILHPDDFAEMVCRSPLYMAPEILQFQRYDEKVDMWSVGAILFELLNGYPPFHASTEYQGM